MRSVPFVITGMHRGLTGIRGTVRAEAQHLVFEIEAKLFGLLQQAPRTIRIELTDLESVAYRRGLRQDRLTLRARPPAALAAVPGANERGLDLRIARADRPDLDVLLERLYLWRTEDD